MIAKLNVKEYFIILGNLIISTLFLLTGFIHSNIINVILYILYVGSLFIDSFVMLILIIGWKSIDKPIQNPLFTSMTQTRLSVIQFILEIIPFFLYFGKKITYPTSLFIIYLLANFVFPICSQVLTIVLVKKFGYISRYEYLLLEKGDYDLFKNVIEEYKELKNSLLIETSVKENSKLFKDLAFEYYNKIFKEI